MRKNKLKNQILKIASRWTQYFWQSYRKE